VLRLISELPQFMNDDFNTAKVLANLFELVPVINSVKDKNTSAGILPASTWQLLKEQLRLYVEDILGLQVETAAETEKLKGVMQILLDLRKEARANKNWVQSDAIRNRLAGIGIQVKDEKDGEMSWTI
jgi:cysteinyl-tRNA synthetase